MGSWRRPRVRARHPACRCCFSEDLICHVAAHIPDETTLVASSILEQRKELCSPCARKRSPLLFRVGSLALGSVLRRCLSLRFFWPGSWSKLWRQAHASPPPWLVLFSSVRSFSYYLFGVQALEPVVLALVGAVAAFAPVRRAVAVQPMDALRHE